MNGEQLKELRKRLNLTQSEMAEKLGITLSAVFKLESGENNMSKPVALLAKQLNSELPVTPTDT